MLDNMGWWNSGADGSSLHEEDTGLSWGDGPADTMDEAIEQIVEEFLSTWGRKPLRAEIEAGLRFSLSVYDDTDVARAPTQTRPGLVNIDP
jgi:hypothetical protein